MQLVKTQEVTNELRELATIENVANIKGTSFIGIQGYENSSNEISNQVILLGANYRNAQIKDLNSYKNFDINSLVGEYDLDLLNKGLDQLISSLEKTMLKDDEKEALRLKNDATINRSDAQKDAYTHIENGIKYHKDTDTLYIYGYIVSKKVIQKGSYKVVKSRPLTLAKNAIKKACNLRTTKFRQFKIENASKLKMQGISI